MTQKQLLPHIRSFRATRDPQSFSVIYKATREYLSNYLLKNWSHLHYYGLEDVVHDTYLQVDKYIMTYNEQGAAFKTWLCTIAKNILLYRLKTPVAVSLIPDIQDETRTDYHHWVETNHAKVVDYILNYNWPTKPLVVGFYLQGLSKKEIAKIAYGSDEAMYQKRVDFNLKSFRKRARHDINLND